MGSRIRENVKHFFECFCEVVPKTAEKDAWIIQKYPDSYKDEEVLKSVPKFAYPCKLENTTIQHYSFVLTDIESKWTFGFCRHDPKTETALVVLSYLPWHQAFYKFLNHVAVLIHSPKSDDLRDFLQSAYNKKVPDPNTEFKVTFNNGQSVFSCDCPDQYKLPSIPENRNLTEYYNAVDMTNMMLIFASMLNERRIIFTSKKLSRLSACVQSANDIIYPMIWQHIFIPVLPMALVDYLLAPMPFLIGVPENVLKTVNMTDIGDVVILNADTNVIETPFDDLNSLPLEIVSSLKRQLRNKSALLGDGVSRAFLRALVQLIGGYRDALVMQEHKDISFNPQAFIESRPSTMQPFLRKMLELQIFQQFIEERLHMLNKGLGFTDQFEIEVHHYSEKSSSKYKQQYKEWTNTMKREFIKVKDKANPAMKSAVKTVKEGGKTMKSAVKDFKAKFKEGPGTEDLSRGLKKPFDKPISAPNSPTGTRKTTSFGNPKATYRKGGLNFRSAVVDSSYSQLAPMPNARTPDSPDRSSTATPGLDIPKIDLLTEMEEIFHRFQPPDLNNSPPVDRSLKPVRSLESFRNACASSPDWQMSQSVRVPHSSNLLEAPDLLNIGGPPVPPRPPPPRDANITSLSTDLFGSTPFVVNGGRNENGDAVFLVASDNCVDVVKLKPPAISPRRSKREEKCEDLIRLDTTTSPDLEDFDPLRSSNRSSTSPPSNISSPDAPIFTKGLTNPLYNYYTPSSPINGNLKLVESSQNQTAKPSPLNVRQPNYENTLNDQHLLREYGIDYSNFSISRNNSNVNVNVTVNSQTNVAQTNCDPFNINSKKQWTTFD